MSVPGWYALILLALAAFRIWRLLAEDDILNRPRRFIVRVPRLWKEGDPPPAGVYYGIVEFIECPYCLGFWVALAWWGAWQIWPHGSLVVAVPFALSALVVGVKNLLSSDS